MHVQSPGRGRPRLTAQEGSSAEGWLRRVWFFEKAEHQFMVEVALTLVPMVFSPGEIATNGYMYIVHRGIALYGGRVLTTGMVWGEAAGWKAPSALPEDRAHLPLWAV